LRYGIQDKPTKTVTGLHADRTADFEAASTLPTGLDGWLDEHRTPGAMGNILIHDKIIVIDFTSDAPVVINGSHNYSNNASAHNDENYLIVRGNVAMADCLGIEVMRLYDHYRFRFVSKSAATKTAGTMKVVQKPMTLDTTNGWTDDYYDATRLKYVDRMLFSGVMHGGAPSLPPPGGSLSAAPSIQQVRAAANAPGTASATMPTKKASTKKAAAKKPNSKTARKLTTPKKTVKKSAKKRSLAAKKAGTQAKGKVTAKKSAPKKAAVTKSVLAKKK
jgi:hypothetical protein